MSSRRTLTPTRDLAYICEKGLLFTNIICSVAGLIFIGASIFLYVDKSDILTDVMYLKLAAPACIMIIACATATVMLSVMGVIASLRVHLIILLIYATLAIIIAIIAIVAGIFSILYISQSTEWIRQSMRESLIQRYGFNTFNDTLNAFETRNWDKAQKRWYCCGIEDNSWNVYRGSSWYDQQPGNKEYDRPRVPPSCCFVNQYGEVVNLQKCQKWTNGPPRLIAGKANEALYSNGCYTYGLTILQRVSTGIVVMGFVLGILQILNASFSLGLFILTRRKIRGTRTYAGSSVYSLASKSNASLSKQPLSSYA